MNAKNLRFDDAPERPRHGGRRRRVLYVERGWTADVGSGYGIVLERLRRISNVETRCDLDEDIVDLVREALAGRPFAAIVTHVPNDPVTYSYASSLDILDRLRRISKVPLIAYTGATGWPWSFIFDRVDRLISKSEPTQDAAKIVASLKSLWKRWASLRSIPAPALRRSGGWTMVDARVGLTSGLAMMAAANILKECSGYAGEVTLRRTDGRAGAQAADCKDMMETMTLAAEEGAAVRIMVRGTNAGARKLARRIYSGITSRYAVEMRFDRFEPEEGRR